MSDKDTSPDPIWLLAEEVSVIEAALLIIGVEPQGISQHIESWTDDAKPQGYLAAREAIVSAVRRELVDGRLENLIFETPHGGYETDHLSTDHHQSKVVVESLRAWLHERGHGFGFLAIDIGRKSGFRDPEHPRYSRKLAAVVDAWEQYDEEAVEVGTPKQRIMIWLRLNADRYGLTNQVGNPSENVLEELAKVANWATTGGAPKATNQKPEPD